MRREMIKQVFLMCDNSDFPSLMGAAELGLFLKLCLKILLFFN